MKFLVDRSDLLVKSWHEEPANAPLGFSVSGKMVVDVPTSLGITDSDGVLANLIAAKNAAFTAQHPFATGLFYDEMLDATGVHAQSSRYFTGPNKRTAMLPGTLGTVITTAHTFPGVIGKVFFHCSLYKLTSEPQNAFGDRPGPSRLVYQEVAASSANVAVSLVDTVSPSTSFLLVTPDSEQNFVTSGPFSFRISIGNLTSDILYLGDWLLLYG